MKLRAITQVLLPVAVNRNVTVPPGEEFEAVSDESAEKLIRCGAAEKVTRAKKAE